MTNKEAVGFIRQVSVDCSGEFEQLRMWYKGIDKDFDEAVKMAVKALEEQEQVDQSAAEIAKLLDDGYFERRMPDVRENRTSSSSTDAVNREDAMRLHCKICRDYCTCYRNPETCEDLKAFEDLPPVTPQPKTGHWIAVENEEMETIGYYCSECDLPMETEKRTDCCPNCGCRMVDPQESEDKE